MDLPDTTAFVSGASRGLGKLDEASPEQARAVLAQLPAPVRMACRRTWQPHYAGRARWEPLVLAS
jgi:hypothetical protein